MQGPAGCLSACQPVRAMTSSLPSLSLDQIADRVEHMVLRYEELQKTNALLQGQLQDITHERDLLKSRLSAARARVDALLARLPQESATSSAGLPPASASPLSPLAATGKETS